MNSRLYLETEVRDKKTYIKDVFFKAPYKIMSPFTDEKNRRDTDNVDECLSRTACR